MVTKDEVGSTDPSGRRCYLRVAVIHPNPEHPITFQRFCELKEARAKLTKIFEFEEFYEIMIKCYLALEKNLLVLAAENMVARYSGSYEDFFDQRVEINVALLNFLTSARLYQDRLHAHVIGCGGDETIWEKVKAERSEEYDAHFGYRFVEALRNHSQHHGLPLQKLSQDSRWNSGDGVSVMEHNVGIDALKNELSGNLKFKTSVLAEMPDVVDLKRACRRYIESLSKVHASIRGYVANPVDAARAMIEKARVEYSQLHPATMLGLTAYAETTQELDAEAPRAQPETVLLILEWDEVRRSLQKRNTALVNLTKSVVTSKSLQ